MTLPNEALQLIDDSTLLHVGHIAADGRPTVKVVWKARNDGCTTVWWRTARSAHGSQDLLTNSAVCAYLYDTETLETLLLNGIATLHSDRDTRHEFWDDSAKDIFRGADDPDYAVVELKVIDGTYTAPGVREDFTIIPRL